MPANKNAIIRCELPLFREGYIRELSRKQINKIKSKYEDDGRSNEATRGLKHWIERNGYSERYLDSNSIDAEDRKSIADNAGLDNETHKGESLGGPSAQDSSENLGTGFIRVYENDGTNGPRYIPINNQNDIEFFTTPQGEVYGFIDKEGNIYLDETKISPEHPGSFQKNEPTVFRKAEPPDFGK